MKLTFSTGSALLPRNGKWQYQVTGNAVFDRQIGRTWTARMEYVRSVQYVEIVPQPYLSDSITGIVQGQASRRVSLTGSIGYLTGTADAQSTFGRLDTYTGRAEVGVALTRNLALYANYLQYHYQIDAAFVALLPAQLDRHTARVGLRMWVPLFD
jgi:hypothetical protein